MVEGCQVNEKLKSLCVVYKCSPKTSPILSFTNYEFKMQQKKSEIKNLIASRIPQLLFKNLPQASLLQHHRFDR